ncbi:unnamed protein product, partial [Mesorhabditis spiculigera]
MLFVYLLVLVLYTGGPSAENTTLTPAMCTPGCTRCAKYWKMCPGKDGTPLCVKKIIMDNPESSPSCNYKKCPVGEARVTTGRNESCIPMKRLTNGTVPDGWWWEDCVEQYHINCGNYLPICVNAISLEAYNSTTASCISKGCDPGMHRCKVDGTLECIPYDDLKSVHYKDDGDECIRATPEEKAAARATVPPAAQEKTEPDETSPASRPSWRLVNIAFILLATKLAAAFV